jgi:hypothetical protein
MGETADQTRAEIIQLRSEMTGKVRDLRRAAQRPIQIARFVAIGAAAVVVVGGAALIVSRIRRRHEEETLPGKARAVADAATDPGGVIEKISEAAREKLRAEIRNELQKEINKERPLYQKVLEMTAKAAASAAIAAALKNLDERASPRSGKKERVSEP